MQSKILTETINSYSFSPLRVINRVSNSFLIISKNKSNSNNSKIEEQSLSCKNYYWPNLLETGINLPISMSVVPKKSNSNRDSTKTNDYFILGEKTSLWVFESLSGIKSSDLSKIDKRGVLWIKFSNPKAQTKLSRDSQYHMLISLPSLDKSNKSCDRSRDKGSNVSNPSTLLKKLSSEYKGFSKNCVNSIMKNNLLGAWVGFLIHLDLVGIGYRVLMERKKISESELQGKSSLPISGVFIPKIQKVTQLPFDVAKKVNDNPLSGDGTSFHDNTDIFYTELTLKLGYSHNIYYRLPTGVGAFSKKPTHLCLYGCNFLRLAQVIAEIRNFRKPDVYKGKGFRYRGEVVKLKIGKKK